MFKTHFLVILLILLLGLSGCTQTASPTPQPAFATSANPLIETDEASLTLTEEQNGGTVALIVGDTVRVRIDGNPSTGYLWEPEKLDSNLLQQVGEPEFTRNNNLPGGGGVYIYTFKALKAGLTHLRLIYHRPFEKDTPPAQIFDVTVEIQG